MQFRVMWKDATQPEGESFVDFPDSRFMEATEFFLEQMEAGWVPILYARSESLDVEVLNTVDMKSATVKE